MAGATETTTLIIGASNPIGVAVSHYLLQHGGRVIFHGGTDHRRFRADCVPLRAQYGHRVRPLWVPIRSSRQFVRAVRRLLPVDSIICIYGPCLSATLRYTPARAYRRIFDLNVVLLAKVATYCLPHLATANYARIIAFGADYSISVRGYSSMALYGSTKWALASMVQSIVLEAHNSHCKGFIICPGYITDGKVTAHNSQHQWKQQEIAQAIISLLDHNTTMPSGMVGKDDMVK